MQAGFYKSRLAQAAFAPWQLAAFGGADNSVTPAAGANAPIAGVSDSLGAQPGQLVDVQMTQIADVQAGGAIAAGDLLTSDANGKAVKAVKQVGATVYVFGIAQTEAVAGDVFQALLAFSTIDG